MREQIRSMEYQITSIGAIRYDKDIVQTSPVNAMEDGIIRLADLKQRFLQKEAEYNEKFYVINAQIDEIQNPLQREVLKSYFIEGKKIWQIADHLHYGEHWVYKNFNYGLKEFERIHKFRKQA